MKRKAVIEVLGLEMRPAEAKEMFLNAYIHLLRNDTRGLMQVLDYREALGNADKATEEYLVCKFILEMLLNQNPGQLETLFPKAPRFSLTYNKGTHITTQSGSN